MERLHNTPAPLHKARVSTLDVIIPTYNKPDTLNRTLQALSEQNIPSSWYVRAIVCDDGSACDVAAITQATRWNNNWRPPLVVSLSHAGRSAARNAGIEASDADIILFLADDIILREGALAAHISFHAQHTQQYMSALGWVMWDPAIRPTPFMEWMIHGGQQNDFDALLDERPCDPASFLYGSHVSLKRSFIGNERFSEDFLEYGWEDLELGVRLKRKGMQLLPVSAAVGLHAHWYDADSLLARQRVIGAQKYLVNTNPMRRIVHGLYAVLGMRAVAVRIMKKWGNRLNFPYFFQRIIAGEFWYGVHHANRVLKSQT